MANIIDLTHTAQGSKIKFPGELIVPNVLEECGHVHFRRQAGDIAGLCIEAGDVISWGLARCLIDAHELCSHDGALPLVAEVGFKKRHLYK
ncbi:hypothetical protein ACLOJK_032075, partial [Asimina triloba]